MIFIRGACLLALFASLISCTGFSKKNRVVLKIQDQTWSVRDIEVWFEKYLQGLDSFEKESKEQVASLKTNFINQFIFQKILENWIKKNNVKLPKQSSKLEDMAQNSKPLDPAIQNRQMYQDMHAQLMKHLLKQIPMPTINEQKTFYARNKKKFYRPDKCLVEEIRVSSKNQAERLREDIKSGKDFQSMRKVYSPHSPAFWLESSLKKPFKDICSKKQGFISPVLKSSFGWHILLIKKRKLGGQKNFKQSQAEIVRHLKSKQLPAQLEKWLKQEISGTNIFIDKKILDKIIIQYKR